MTVTPAGHPIRLRRATDGRLWIDFSDLCVDTTAPSDYLALTESFQHWIISGIPGLLTAGREPTQRFANVIDVLYDRDITTTFISAVPLSEFTDGASLPHDIARIMSSSVNWPPTPGATPQFGAGLFQEGSALIDFEILDHHSRIPFDL